MDKRLKIFKFTRIVQKQMRKCHISLTHIGASLETANKVAVRLERKGYKVEIIKGSLITRYALVVERKD